jgi:hypothetical protein
VAVKLATNPVQKPDKFSNHNGVKEGDALFPLLFKMMFSNTPL